MAARIVVTEFVSLDGVMEAPGGEPEFKYPGWTFEFDRGDDGNQFKLDETQQADALLIGLRTYESFAGAWPKREGEFADKFNAMPKFVVSTTLNDHHDFPDALCVIGVMEGENDLSMQYFDSRGVHRVYAIGFDGRELTLERDAPGFAQRVSAKLSDDGSALAGVWQLNEDDQGYRDDLAFTYRRASGGDG